jgi:murein DD-endopeptidase MepM/ murein hydrolase activator NlpD
LQVTVTQTGFSVYQGHTLSVHVETNRPAQLTGLVADRFVDFVETPTGGWALIGFGPYDKVRPYTLQITARDEIGVETTVTSTIEVAPMSFGIDYLTIPPDRTPLLDPKIREEENRYLRQIFAQVSPDPLWEKAFIQPVDNVITSPFGRARSYNNQPATSFHAGIDIRGKPGTEVHAAARGKVVLAKETQVRGNIIVLDHGHGVYTVYAHLKAFNVEPGDMVERGQVIGQVGSTGLVTGPHLHWEVRVGGAAVDPLQWTEQLFP